MADIGVFESDLPDAASTTEDVATTVGKHGVEPRVEATLVPQSRQVDPGRDERFLRRISSIGLIAEDRPRYTHHLGQSGCDQSAEGIGVAPTGSPDENLVCRAGYVGDGLSQLQSDDGGDEKWSMPL